MILSERYRDFTMLETPVPFDLLMEGRNISIVQVHDATPVGDHDIVGFSGVFCWKDGQAVPLDGDIYNKSMTVLGYSWFTVDDTQCLDVLVKGDW